MKENKVTKAIQIKITLLDVKPPVWRRLLIKDDITLNQLHYNIQAAMPWTNSHLHEFEIKKQYYAPLSEYDDIDGVEDRKDTDIPLSSLNLIEGDKILYIYDFGDYWCHQILIEKFTPVDDTQVYPVCIKASRACPPEDCGGFSQYIELQQQLADKSHPEYDDAVESLGDNFDPAYVSLEDINEALHSEPIEI